MSAKTYDEEQEFDMQAKWEDFIKELEEIHYEGVSTTVVLNLLSLVLSRTKECKRKTILALDKQEIIDTWDAVISALKDSIDYFRTTYRIPVSRILPFDALLASFAYFFFWNTGAAGTRSTQISRRVLLANVVVLPVFKLNRITAGTGYKED